MRYGEEARKFNRDQTQSYRRTKKQNEALIDLINSVKPVRPDDIWGCSDLPPEGGVLEVTHPRSHRIWTIELDGTTKEKRQA